MLAHPSGDHAPAVDVLSDVLRTVRLSGALFFLVDARAPWEIAVPDGATLASAVRPGAQRVISYHVVTGGVAWGRVLPDGPPTRLEAGDVLVLPHGDAYVMSIGRDRGRGPEAAEVMDFMRAMSQGRLPFRVVEGGAGSDRLRLVCGFLSCDVRPYNPLLATLPRLLHVRRAEADTDVLARLLDLTVAEARDTRAGSDCVRLRLSELMFVELLRRHVGSAEGRQTGWLAGLRDGVVGRALARLHESPARPWTLLALAREVGLSRSALAERFTRFVGRPPMQYLASWRMQLAARRLADGDAKVAAVALDVGYDSEAAFSRAFRRATGIPPAEWRRRQATGGKFPRRLRRR
ncbi:MAG TPA: AraC family transcriptional regulator [Methylomirabilota bacterium]|nr:AraC family transcriptional regulator [Methylomirabilota bacterium]